MRPSAVPLPVMELNESRKSYDVLPTIINKLNPMNRDKSVPPQTEPASIKSHIPNIYLNKYSSRKGDILTMIMNDDSNIEYNNIFP